MCLPFQCITSVGATNLDPINPISVPKHTTCAEQLESKQTTRTPDKFAPTHSTSDEFVQPSLVIQSPTQHHTRLFEPTTSDGGECIKHNIAPMDQQQQNDKDNSSRNVNKKIDAESGNGARCAEEKKKEEVLILSTEKTSDFSKTATISIVSDVAGDTLNRYGFVV